MRRACWPKDNRLWGLHRVWHIWHRDDVGDQSKFEGGLVQGWGGQIGAFDAEIVLVNGDEKRDGSMYQPAEGDRLADDWEVAYAEAV
jgi:hypothetical protein